VRSLGKLSQSAFVFSAAEVVNRLINLIAMMIASRHYGVAEFGRLGVALALTAILTIMTRFIAPASLTRELCLRPDERVPVLANYLWQRLAVMLVSTGLLAVAIAVSQPERLGLYVCCYLYLYGIETVITSRGGIIAQERFREASISSVAHSLLIFAAAYVPVRVGWPLEMMVAALATVQVLALGIVLGLSSLHGYPLKGMLRQPVNWGDMWLDLKRNRALWLAGLFIAGYARLNVVFCQFLQGDYEAGLFTAGQRLFLGLGLVASVYQQTTYPRMVRDVADRKQTGDYMELSGRLLVVTGQFLALLTTLGGVGLMAAIWGREFGASSQAARILVWALTFNFVSLASYNILVAEHRFRTLMWVTLAGLVVNIGANAGLVSAFGAVGAASATVLTEAFVLAGMLLALARYGRTLTLASVVVRSSVVSAAAVALGSGLTRLGAPPTVVLLLGTAAFLAGVRATRIIRRRDLVDVYRRLMPEPKAAPSASPVDLPRGSH